MERANLKKSETITNSANEYSLPYSNEKSLSKEEFEALFDSGYNSAYNSKICSTTNSTTQLFKSPAETQDEENMLNVTSKVQQKPNWQDSGLSMDSGLSIDSSTIIPDYVKTDFSRTASSNLFNVSASEAYQPDEDGDTFLHLAIIKGMVDVCYSLIRLANHPDDLDMFNNLLQTPLHLATLTKQSRVVRRLVIAGATLNSRDRHGNTALHIACKNGDIDCVKSILTPITEEDIIDASVVSYPVIIQPYSTDLLLCRNYEGNTCIHQAARIGCVKLIEYLVNHGIDINALDGKSGKSVLHWAVETQKLEFVQFLLKKCRANVNLKSYSGQTPLLMAWNLFNYYPNNSRVRRLIQLLKDFGGEPPYPPKEIDSESEYTSDDDENDEVADYTTATL